MEEEKPKEKVVDFKKDVQPSIDSLFTGKYDIIVKPSEESSEDAPCNISIILRVVLFELSQMAKTIKELKDKEVGFNKYSIL
jgi:hypothetical protein